MGRRFVVAFGHHDRPSPVAAAIFSAISAFMDQDIKARKLSGTARLDATTDAAYAIIDKRMRDRESKTAKLKALRLEREATERAVKAGAGPKPKPKRARKPEVVA